MMTRVVTYAVTVSTPNEALFDVDEVQDEIQDLINRHHTSVDVIAISNNSEDTDQKRNDAQKRGQMMEYEGE